jgi:hypothetical protein
MSDERIEGLSKLQSKLARAIKNVDGNMLDALMDCGQDLCEKAKSLAPIDNGDLRNSGYVEKQNKDVVVGFNTTYALRQHEELSCNHPQGGQAKYLEQPFKENIGEYIKHIKDTARSVI